MLLNLRKIPAQENLGKKRPNAPEHLRERSRQEPCKQIRRSARDRREDTIHPGTFQLLFAIACLTWRVSLALLKYKRL